MTIVTIGVWLPRSWRCRSGRSAKCVLSQQNWRSAWLFPLRIECGTIVAMSSESLRTVRDRFSEFIDRVQSHHERVIVTKNGTPAAVLISPEDLESLEETAAVLGDSEAVAELVEAHRAYLQGDVVRGVDAVKALRPR